MKATIKKPLMTNKALMASKLRASATPKKRRIRQTLDRFVVVATNLNNVPKDSSGWTASLTTGTTTITADFDDFGVVRFPTIATLTTVSYILRIRDANGVVLTNKTIPADREFYVARF